MSATATEPSGNTATPSGCWNKASSAGPSRWPKSNSPCPTAVATSPVRTSRSADVSASATHSTPSPAARPEGWAKNASAGGPSRSPSLVVPAHAAVAPVARVPRPELVVARHRDDHAPVPPSQVPRRRQLGRGLARCDPLAELGAGARHRGDGAVGHPDPAQGVVDAVGHQHVAVRQQEQPQRLVEAGCEPVHQTPRARPDPPPLRDQVGLQLDELVVGGVGHQERRRRGAR